MKRLCINCDTELGEDDLFCRNCGTMQETTGVEQNDPTKMPNAPDFAEYVDSRLREQTPFLDTLSFIEGAKPLKWRWPVTFAATVLGVVIDPFIGIAVFMAALLLNIFVCSFLLTKRNQKKYSMNGKKVDCEELAVFLSKHLQGLPFSAWKRGNPAFLGIRNSKIEVVECMFKQKTYHRIIFDTKYEDTYQISTNDTSRKERIKNGGKTSSAVMYKADCIARPILEAAVEYYLQFHCTAQC